MDSACPCIGKTFAVVSVLGGRAAKKWVPLAETVAAYADVRNRSSMAGKQDHYRYSVNHSVEPKQKQDVNVCLVKRYRCPFALLVTSWRVQRCHRHHRWCCDQDAWGFVFPCNSGACVNGSYGKKCKIASVRMDRPAGKNFPLPGAVATHGVVKTAGGVAGTDS